MYKINIDVCVYISAIWKAIYIAIVSNMTALISYNIICLFKNIRKLQM